MGAAGRARHKGWLLAGAGVLALLVALACAEWAGWPFLRGPVERHLAKATGVQVRLAAPFRLQLIGTPHVDVAELHIGAPVGIDVPFLLDARRV